MTPLWVKTGHVQCQKACPLGTNCGQYLIAALDKFLRRGRHPLLQLIENPALQLRRVALGDIDFARQRGQCTILRVEQPIENGPFSIVE